MEKKKHFKTRVTGTDPSILDKTMTLKDVGINKIKHLIEQVLNEPSHIISITKNQIAWGSKHFHDLHEDDPLRAGFIGSDAEQRKHIYGRRPTDSAYQRMENAYGIVFKYPPEGLFDLIQTCFREMVDRMIDEELKIAIVPMTGYISKDGKSFNPNWNKFEPWHSARISEYLIYAYDKERFAKVKEYALSPTIDKAHYRLKLVIERTKITSADFYGSQTASAETRLGKAEKRTLKLMQSSLPKLKTTEKNIDWNALKAADTNGD